MLISLESRLNKLEDKLIQHDMFLIVLAKRGEIREDAINRVMQERGFNSLPSECSIIFIDIKNKGYKWLKRYPSKITNMQPTLIVQIRIAKKCRLITISSQTNAEEIYQGFIFSASSNPLFIKFFK